MDGEPCFAYFLDEDPLQVRVLLSLKFQPPEVPEPQFPVPVLLAPRVPAEHEVDAVLLVVDQLVSVPRSGLYDLPGGPVVRLVVIVLVDETPATGGDLVHPETVTHRTLSGPALFTLKDNTQFAGRYS